MLYTRVVTGSGEDERAEAGEVIVQVARKEITWNRAYATINLARGLISLVPIAV